jgi:hypothetical protein
MHRSVWRRRLALPAFCILHSALLISLTACGAKAKAQTLPDGPPLAVPTAPAHQIVIEQVAEAPPQEPAPEPVAAQPAPQPANTGRPSVLKPSPPPPANQPAVTAPVAEPPVRAAPAAAAGDEKKAQQLIAKATEDLTKRIDYQKLSAQGKEQYEQSKRFRDQAEQAIKEKNVLFALTLAEKAATLAAELVR